jgi:hypothetical protein
MHAQYPGKFKIVVYDQNADCVPIRHTPAAFLGEAFS